MDATVRRYAGAVVFAVAGLQYVALEAVAASAWVDPRYDYAGNYISDLGVPVAQVYRGRDIDSPLAWAMNTAFVLQGVLFAAGAALVAVLFTGGVRRALLWFALLHGAGMVLVGAFHEAAGAGPLHHAGAGVGVLFGNLAVLVVGAGARGAGLPRWFGGASVVLPVLGLLGEAVLFSQITPDRFDGLWERAGVYSIVVWQLLFAAVLVGVRSRRTAHLRPHAHPYRTGARGRLDT